MINSLIRSAKKEDLPSLEQLYIQCMGKFEYAYYRTNFHSYITSNHDLIKVSEEPSGYLSGFAIVYIDNTQEAKIQAIFVSKDYRKQGVGSNLLRSLEKEVLTQYPDLSFLSIRLPEEYFVSQSFFLKREFHSIAKINGYVKHDLDFPFAINNEIEVRKAKKSDLDEILQIENACFSKYWQMNKEKFKQILKNNTEVLFVAILNKTIVGYNFNAISRVNQSGNYIRIATLPDLQEQYIATTLTAQAFKWFKSKSVTRVVLSTFADSLTHNEMYQKWGFQKHEQELILARTY
ncbi:MAG: GNAT family N-acetyltransferase [Candidatus Hodarchaeales archaeon]|jgi:ribosomal protein S18 acetylase RimI-like enzyme